MVAYIDGWGYQDNLLPDYMTQAGHDVVVVTSKIIFRAFLKKLKYEKFKKKVMIIIMVMFMFIVY